MDTHTVELVDLYHITNETQATLALVAKTLDALHNKAEHMYTAIDSFKLAFRIKAICDTLQDITTDLEMGHVHLGVFDRKKVLNLIGYYAHRWNLQTLVDRFDEKFEDTLTSKVISQGNLKIGLIMVPFFPEE